MSHPDHSPSPDNEPTQAQPQGAPQHPGSVPYEHTRYDTQYPGNTYPAAHYGNGQYHSAQYANAQQPVGPYGNGQQPVAPQKSPGGLSGFLKALFDTTFTRFVTPSMVRILYILSMICIGLYWIGSMIVLFAASRTHDSYGDSHLNGGVMTLAVLDLLFGWIIALISLAFVRMQFEFVMALIRTTEYARDIKTHLTGSSTPNL